MTINEGDRVIVVNYEIAKDWAFPERYINEKGTITQVCYGSSNRCWVDMDCEDENFEWGLPTSCLRPVTLLEQEVEKVL